MIRLHLQIVGALLLSLGVAHACFDRYFGWKNELRRVSLLTRQIFFVHCFFIALLLVLLGVCSLFYADALLTPGPLNRVVLAGFVVFWVCRLAVQFAVYDPSIWRGRRFFTVMHVLFSMLWCYTIVTYGLALRVVWNG
jgi:hypothetical protein